MSTSTGPGPAPAGARRRSSGGHPGALGPLWRLMTRALLGRRRSLGVVLLAAVPVLVALILAVAGGLGSPASMAVDVFEGLNLAPDDPADRADPRHRRPRDPDRRRHDRLPAREAGAAPHGGPWCDARRRACDRRARGHLDTRLGVPGAGSDRARPPGRDGARGAPGVRPLRRRLRHPLGHDRAGPGDRARLRARLGGAADVASARNADPLDPRVRDGGRERGRRDRRGAAGNRCRSARRAGRRGRRVGRAPCSSASGASAASRCPRRAEPRGLRRP